MEESEDSGIDSRWGNLPPDLILSIVSRVSFPDFFRSRGVCQQWWQALMSSNNPISSDHFQPPKFPFLILSSEHGEQSESCTLLSLPERRLYHLTHLPQIRNRCFIGSNGNWLVTLNLALEPRLLNPFTHEESPLPSLIAIPDPQYLDLCVPMRSGTWVGFYYSAVRYPTNFFRDHCIQKIIPSSHNSNCPPDCVVVAYGLGHFVHKVRLALVRPGDCAWTLVPLPLSYNDDEDGNDVSDVVHNADDGRFYAVTKGAVVLAFHPDNPEHVKVIFKDVNPPFHSKKYLVFSSDNILLVERCRKFHGRINRTACSGSERLESLGGRIRTVAFRIYKISTQTEGHMTFPLWTRLKHLSGRCLMLGNNHSISLSLKQVPGLKENCIYFTDDYSDNLFKNYREHPRDVGVYDMQLDTIDQFLTDYSSHTWPPPIWFLPSLHMY